MYVDLSPNGLDRLGADRVMTSKPRRCDCFALIHAHRTPSACSSPTLFLHTSRFTAQSGSGPMMRRQMYGALFLRIKHWIGGPIGKVSEAFGTPIPAN